MGTIDELRKLRGHYEQGKLEASSYREQRLGLLSQGPSAVNHLVVLEGAARQTHELRQCEFQIGGDTSAPDNDLVLGLPTLSGRHAVFRFTSDGNWVKDLRSTNGTFVNGQRLEAGAKMQLRPGDQISLSRELIFVFEGSRDEGGSEGRSSLSTDSGAQAVLPSSGSGGFRLLGGVVLEPGEYVLAVKHVQASDGLRLFAYSVGFLLALTVVLAPFVIWAYLRHHRGPGYLLRFYLTNRRAIESHQRQYANIWFEDLIDVYRDTKGTLVAKDRPRFGLPGAVNTVHADSRTIEFSPMDQETRVVFEEILQEARKQRSPLTGRPPHMGPY